MKKPHGTAQQVLILPFSARHRNITMQSGFWLTYYMFLQSVYNIPVTKLMLRASASLVAQSTGWERKRLYIPTMLSEVRCTSVTDIVSSASNLNRHKLISKSARLWCFDIDSWRLSNNLPVSLSLNIFSLFGNVMCSSIEYRSITSTPVKSMYSNCRSTPSIQMPDVPVNRNM